MKKTIKSRTGRSVSGLSGPSDAERFSYQHMGSSESTLALLEPISRLGMRRLKCRRLNSDKTASHQSNAVGFRGGLLPNLWTRIPAAPSCPRPDVRAGGPGFAIERACDCTRGGIETLALGLSLKQCKPPGEIATSRNTARTESGRVQSTFYTQLWIFPLTPSPHLL